jgi:predicted O-methyltransferase YrrM
MNYQDGLRPQTRAALARMAQEQDVRGSTPEGELNLIVAFLGVQRATNVLQLGTYLGWSALVLADLVYTRGFVLTVDPEPGYLQQARRYARLAELNNLHCIQGFSQDEAVIAKVSGGPSPGSGWDAIYIDTTHHYAQTCRELEIYCGRVATPGTLVLLHDASTHAQSLDVEGKGGVKQAIHDWLAAHPEWQGMICEPPVFPEAQFGLGVLAKKSEVRSAKSEVSPRDD